MNNQLKELFERYLENQCEAKDIESLVEHFDTHDEVYLRELILNELQQTVPGSTSMLDENNEEDKFLALQSRKVYTRLFEKIEAEKAVEKLTLKRVIPLWKKMAAAIALILGMGIGGYYFTGNDTPEQLTLSEITPESDISPGGNRATLMRSDGMSIDLSTSQDGIVMTTDNILYGDGATIAPTPQDTSLLTLSTPTGGQYRIVLEDGTKIWLNAASTLKYPSKFDGAQRRVELEGEAYFEVAKNTKQPFVVHSADQTVTVLGTHFSITAYPDEEVTKTALIEGAVRIQRHQGAKTTSTLLRPNQQSRIIRGSEDIQVSTIELEAAPDWKNGDFVFKGEDLNDAMRKIARWYDVEVVYDTNAPSQAKLGGWVSRSNNLSKVLEWIESTSDVRFKLEGRRIIVTN